MIIQSNINKIILGIAILALAIACFILGFYFISDDQIIMALLNFAAGICGFIGIWSVGYL